MEFSLAPYAPSDAEGLLALVNEIIAEGNTLPWDSLFDQDSLAAMVAAQTAVICAKNQEGLVIGFYILHPNHIGRLAHIANASYGITGALRGRGLGRRLVEDSLDRAKAHQFKAMQFNAVVADNLGAIKLYDKLGFQRIGLVKDGFRLKDDSYQDIILFIKYF